MRGGPLVRGQRYAVFPETGREDGPIRSFSTSKIISPFRWPSSTTSEHWDRFVGGNSIPWNYWSWMDFADYQQTYAKVPDSPYNVCLHRAPSTRGGQPLPLADKSTLRCRNTAQSWTSQSLVADKVGPHRRTTATKSTRTTSSTTRRVSRL